MRLILIFKNLAIFFVYYILSFLLTQNTVAQALQDSSLVVNKFDILRSQVDLFSAYIKLSKVQLNLLSEADSLGANGEYEIGLVYLEEILNGLNDPAEINKIEELNQTQLINNIDKNKKYNISLISGIDYDRHEFEYTYETNDSTILEELNKPYFGMSLEYIFLQNENTKLNFYNSTRYDNENLRDNYQVNFLYNNLALKFGGYFNNSYVPEYSSYWENNMQVSFKNEISKNTTLYFRNIYNYKIYKKSDLNYTDYYRNFFETNFVYKYSDIDLVFNYENEINEYLGNANYDYLQHAFETGYRGATTGKFQHSVLFDFEHRNYEILYGDSTIANNYNQYSGIINLDFVIYKSFAFQLENQFIKKSYKYQSTFEPNYIWNYLKPGFEVDVFSSFHFGIGYEWETKSHSLIEGGGEATTEQDYNSNGIYSSVDYFTFNGIMFSFSMSYQKRKYPDSPVNDLINLYSSRNILSIIALGNIPVTNALNLNILAVYDNDKDIDNDQGNTQSSIYNIEVEYKF